MRSIIAAVIAPVAFSLFILGNARAQDNASEPVPGPEDSSAPAADGTAETENGFSVDVTGAVYSAYMFRGQNLYDGMSFQPSVQPHYSLGDYGNLSGLVFMHIPADGVEAPAKFIETDYGITYDYTVSKFTFSAGNLWYAYPNKHEHIHATSEVFGSVSADIMLHPTFSIYHDYKEFHAQYYELNLSHTFEKSGEEAFNVTPFAAFGFASNSEKVYNDSGLEQITTGVSTELTVGDVKLTPSLAYSFKIDEKTVDKFWMGLVAVYNFS